MLGRACAGFHVSATASLMLSGEAKDDVDLERITWSNNRGGGGTCTGSQQWSAGLVTLAKGENVITATAHDAAGNTRSASITVTYDPPDRTPPQLAVLVPVRSDAYATTSATLYLSGDAYDADGVTAVRWRNSAGGNGTCEGTAKWSATLSLRPGENAVTIEARDAAGNRGTAVLKVTYTPPRACGPSGGRASSPLAAR